MPHRISFRWSQSSQGVDGDDSQGLVKRLSAVAQDESADAQDVVRETAELIRRWIKDRPHSWEKTPQAAGAELEAGLSEWVERQGWRGSCANFVQSIRTAFAAACEGSKLRAGLIEELGSWTHEPHEPGGPLPSSKGLTPHALKTLQRGEEILLHGRSAALLEATTRAQQAGLFPRVTLALSAGDQAGKRTARQLSTQGIAVRLVWDAALMSCVSSADQIWLATEGIGPGAFISRIGANSLVAEANRLEIPVSVLCTTDAILPGGDMALPDWGVEEKWHLWSEGPEGVELETQPYQIIDGRGVTRWITEEGTLDLGDLCVRHQQLGSAPTCGSTYDNKNVQSNTDSAGLTATFSDDR
jgi:hypothetical protein